jgi:cation diffusion facilitator CzcD-associated flavoprotein CzcO
MDDILDVVIIGAGLSGIGAACHLRRECPERTLAILEARERSGGTWDLFRYPGIRSDSDMHTLGYSFKPWEESKAIADGPSILRYVRETAREYGVESLIRYQHRVSRANWDSDAGCWELTVRAGPGADEQTLRARFIQMCPGYYSYERGHQPDFPGRESFRGEFVHPQFWPEDLDYRNKRVLVIGSGATAMTLVPSMADEAKEVIMLQRSPTWVVSRPSRDRLANLLRAVLPKSWAYNVIRWKNTRLQHWFYKQTRKKPEKIRKMLLDETCKQLAGAGSIEDFTPRYDPWDQRLCLVPDSDLFAALRAGKARIVTAQIDTLTPDGVRLSDGTDIAADIIVSATGLEMELMGGIDLRVDGSPFDLAGSWSYRGMMCTGLPNLVSVFGYINASWTLRADLVSQWFCGLLKHMQQSGATVVTPALEEGLPPMEARPWVEGFSAGYMQRVMHLFPRQGDRVPWVNSQNYLRECREFAEMDFDEPALRYSSVASDSDKDAPRRVA